MLAGGQVLLETQSPTFAELASEAPGGVRHHGAGDPRMCLKLLKLAADMGAVRAAAQRAFAALQ